MADANASKRPKGTNAKIGDKEVMIPNSNFRSKLKYVGDTNIGTIDMIQLRDRLRDSQSSIAKKIYKSGVVHAAAFPPTLPCPELIMECASRLNIQRKSVMMEGEKVLANISSPLIEDTFNIPKQNSTEALSMDQATRFYHDSQDTYFAQLKQNWLHERKKGVTKTSKLTKSDFKPEYGDLIVLLNRIMGSAQGMQFEFWMYYFIDGIISGKKKFDWAAIISENLELQLRTVLSQRQFYMGSYLFYLIARLFRQSGLEARGEIGHGPGQYLVYECYPQLHLRNTKDFKIFYDAFAMKLVRMLQGTPARRLSPEAEAKVKKYGSWFIQFAQFTYIRVAGCTTCPKRLPRFPPDRLVLMELARQLEQYDKMMKQRGEAGVTLSLVIGNDSCPNHVAFASAEKELEQYHLAWYRARQGFDPHGLIKTSQGGTFRHVPTIEDFWANAQDDFHVRKLAFSRLSLSLMRAIKWKNRMIPDQMEEDEDVLREDYSTVEGTELEPVNWNDHQDLSLEAINMSVELHTEWWYDQKLSQLQRSRVRLTYEKMKPVEVQAESGSQQGEGDSQQQP